MTEAIIQFQKGCRIPSEVKGVAFVIYLSLLYILLKFKTFINFAYVRVNYYSKVQLWYYWRPAQTTERNALLDLNSMLITYDIYVKRQLCLLKKFNVLFLLITSLSSVVCVTWGRMRHSKYRNPFLKMPKSLAWFALVHENLKLSLYWLDYQWFKGWLLLLFFLPSHLWFNSF